MAHSTPVSSSDDRVALAHLLDRFLSGDDRSRMLVNEIEGVVITSFSEEEWFDDVSVALALHAPGQGTEYLTDDDLERVLRPLRERL